MCTQQTHTIYTPDEETECNKKGSCEDCISGVSVSYSLPMLMYVVYFVLKLYLVNVQFHQYFCLFLVLNTNVETRVENEGRMLEMYIYINYSLSCIYTVLCKLLSLPPSFRSLLSVLFRLKMPLELMSASTATGARSRPTAQGPSAVTLRSTLPFQWTVWSARTCNSMWPPADVSGRATAYIVHSHTAHVHTHTHTTM